MSGRPILVPAGLGFGPFGFRPGGLQPISVSVSAARVLAGGATKSCFVGG